MAGFKTYLLNEGRSKGIEAEEAAEIFKKNCKGFDFNKHHLYRGTGLNDNYGLVDPRNGVARKSAYEKFNYYTLLMDGLNCFIKYPQRSRSLICATSEHKARMYGSTLYRIIPFNNADIAVAPREDIWYSFPYVDEITKISSMDKFNRVLDITLKKHPKFKEVKTFKDLLSMAKDITADSISYSDQSASFRKLLETMADNLARGLNMIMDPKKNGFELVPTHKLDSYKLEDREAWTDSPCLMIKEGMLNAFKYHIGHKD